MPPALSDYSDSEVSDNPTEVSGSKSLSSGTQPGEPDSFQSTSVTMKCLLPITKGKNIKSGKRPALLRGINLNNIISAPENEDQETMARDTLLPSSIPNSSYRTRAQIHGPRKAQLHYDQAYHPIDEYIRPKRASRLRSKYGEPTHDSDDEATTYSSDTHSFVEPASDTDELKDAKRRKLSHPPSPQIIRRSSRQVNRNVIYNSNVHPQDAELESSDSSQATESSAEHHMRGSASSETDDISKGEYKAIERKANIQIFDISVNEDSNPEYLLHSPTPSTPIMLTAQSQHPSHNSIGKSSGSCVPNIYKKFIPLGKDLGQSMVAHTESIQAHSHIESSAASLMNFEHDDKENRMTSPDTGSVSCYHSAIYAQSPTESQGNVAPKEHDSSLDDESKHLIDSFNHKSPNKTTDADGALPDDGEQVDVQARSDLNSIPGRSSSEASENPPMGGDQILYSKPLQIGSEYDSILGCLSPSRQDL